MQESKIEGLEQMPLQKACKNECSSSFECMHHDHNESIRGCNSKTENFKKEERSGENDDGVEKDSRQSRRTAKKRKKIIIIVKGRKDQSDEETC